ncbi:hypothetical protein SLEP1_g32837 [Rubroshorea leprosula]|uniref:AP2/ERF domain-containing protein n=1 Tax=Rubroshorea leprosula TaxID=152421 RepID=A0AAV5KER1_9ROSI|nr:hypothetical protein SLEP1_g32837 [Rubroshorea leprosula]
MEMNSIFSDLFAFGSGSTSADKRETSTSSDGGTERGASHSDEEVHLLATSRPKKRAGRKVFKETRHPIFRGVRWRNGDKWVCELREPHKKARIWLGTYPTPEMAARAHDVAALAFRGKGACLNFADSAWRLPVPASMSAVDIRSAATEAAAMFRPQQVEAKQDEGSDSTQESRKAGEGEVISSYDYDAKSEKTWDANMRWSEFVDEEVIFDMPGLLVDMAQGLLLSPPRCDSVSRDVEAETEVSLWNFPF